MEKPSTVKNTRDIITQGILDQLPDGDGIALSYALKTWYRNIRHDGGMRLTDVGWQMLQGLALEHHRIDIDVKAFRKQHLLELDRKLQYPYYIDVRHRQLVLFSSREAMMAALFGDISAWLNSISK